MGAEEGVTSGKTVELSSGLRPILTLLAIRLYFRASWDLGEKKESWLSINMGIAGFGLLNLELF